MANIRSFVLKIMGTVSLYSKLLLVVLAFALMVVTSSIFVSNMLRSHLHRDATDMLTQMGIRIEAELTEPRATLSIVSVTLRSMIMRGESAETVFRYLRGVHAEMDNRAGGFMFDGFFAYFEAYEGAFFHSGGWEPQENYDPTGRPWYEAALESGSKIGVTPIYFGARTNQWVITYVQRIFSDAGEPLAVMCLNMPVDRIRDFVADMNLTESSYGVLEDENFDVIYHPNPDFIGKNANDIASGMVQVAEAASVSSTFYQSETTNTQGVYMVTVAVKLENGWILSMLTPKSEYYQAWRRMLWMLCILGAGLAVALGLVLVSIDKAKNKAFEESRRKDIMLASIEKQKEVDERAQLMLDLAPFGINFWDKDLTNLAACNETAVRMYGMGSKQEYIDEFWRLSPEFQPDGRKTSDAAAEVLNKAYVEGYHVCEWMHQKPNGEEMPCEITLVRVEYKDEKTVLGYMRDLRQIKAALVEKEEADRRVQLMLDSTPLGATFWDANSFWDKNSANRICNEEMARLFGLNNRLEYFDRFSEISPERQPNGRLSVELARENIDKAVKEGYVRFEWMHQKLNGEPIPCEITLVRVKFKDDFAIAGYIRDLREQKQMMKKIEQRDNLLNAMNHVASVLLATENEENMEASIYAGMEILGRAVDVDRVQIWQNEMIDDAFCFTIKYEWLSEIGKEKAAVPAGFSLPYSEKPEWERKFLDKEYINSPVHELPQSDQDLLLPFDIKSIVMIPMFLQDRFWGFFSLDDCLKERRFSEEEIDILRSGGLLIANAFLRNEMTQNVRNTAVQLEVALKEAWDANVAKSKFLATMSHEIRTPMNVILGITESYLEDKNLSHEMRDGYEKIYNAGDLLLHIINDILDLSKIEAGKLELILVKYEVMSMINDAAHMNTVRFQHKPIKFNLHVNENIPAELYGDELRIKQILNNLLNNAFKYTDSGEVNLYFDVENSAQSNNVILLLRVSDTGQGMAEDQLKRLFNDYTRFNLETNRNTVGTGLGMAITRNLVSLMNGDITVESEVGKGTVFTVRLPQRVNGSGILGRKAAVNLQNFIFKNPAQEKYGKIQREPMPYGKVLVVDDMESNLDVAKLLLKPYQLQIDTAKSGFDAIDIIKTGKDYDIIFMDHMMPKMDGVETANKLRDLGYRYPIIALTANAVLGQSEMFLANGFDGYISKPIDMRQLNDSLNKFIRDKELMRNGKGLVMSDKQTPDASGIKESK